MVALVSRKSPVQVLGQSGAASSVTGTTDETTLATITVPAGAMGANGHLDVETLWTVPNNANTKTIKVKFGATSLQSIALTATASVQTKAIVANRNNPASQVFWVPSTTQAYVGTTGANQTSSVDTTQAVNITITGTCGNAADTITLERYIVRLYPAS